jgi:hypothetical protein
MIPLYCTVPNTNGILSCHITGNHDSAVSTAIIEARSTTLGLGDQINIDMGYVGDHQQLFTGYVKQIDKNIPDNTYQITAYDELIRAQDYFIVSGDPNTPFTRQNITAEDLVAALLALAGLTSFDPTPTSFTFGVQHEFEVNLVNLFDYCKMIADTLTWTLWADQDGTINFKNRKPYVMTGETNQPGDVADQPLVGYIFSYANEILDFSYSKSERPLRNRVVVYGSEGIHAEASQASSVLPAGFYKSSVLAFPQLIDTQGLAQDIADYNLDLLNRIGESITCTVTGNTLLQPRVVLDSNVSGYSGYWYVYSCDHQWSKTGYTTALDLRRLTKV